VNDYQWLNRGHPQTLLMATVLLYVEGVLTVLRWGAILDARSLPIGVAMLVGGFGVANDKKWGYGLAPVAAALNVAVILYIWQWHAFSDISVLLDLMFDGALVALLLHPMSRSYQRIWFR
jgi:hypothetical protein